MSTTKSHDPKAAGTLSLRPVAHAELSGSRDQDLAIKVIGVGAFGAEMLDSIVQSGSVQGDVEFMHALTADRRDASKSNWPDGDARTIASFTGAALVVVVVCTQEIGDLHAAEAVVRAARSAGALAVTTIAPLPASPAGSAGAVVSLAECVDALIPLPHLLPGAPVQASIAEYLVSIVATLSAAFGPDAPVCIDFEDVRTVLGQCGKVRLGIGQSFGQDRAILAATQAIEDIGVAHMMRASAVLVLISGSRKMRLREFARVMNAIRSISVTGADLVLGVGCDEQAGDAMKIVLIAAKPYK